MRALPHLASVTGLWAACAFSALAQLTEHAPVLSVETNLVTLAITVVDRKGEFVAGLRPEHFTVYDDGEPRPIEFFTTEDLPATIGLVIDSSGSMRRRREQITAAAMAFAALSHPLEQLVSSFRRTRAERAEPETSSM